MRANATGITNREKEIIAKSIQPDIDRCTDSNGLIFIITLLRHTGWGKKRMVDFLNTYAKVSDEYMEHWKDGVLETMAADELGRIGISLEDVQPKHLSWNERACRRRIENKSASELISINKANELHSEMVAFGNYFKAKSVVK